MKHLPSNIARALGYLCFVLCGFSLAGCAANPVLAEVMYRNPMEEWWWESGAAYWFAFVVLGILVLCGVVIGFDSLASWWRKGRK